MSRLRRTPRFRSSNPHRLYRDRDNAVIAGVCAGLADYLGWDTTLLRVCAILGLFMFFPPVLFTYLLLALIVPKKPEHVYDSEESEEFWRSVSTRPRETFSALRQKFREMDSRLNRLERRVTEEEYELNRKFEDLARE